MKKIILISLVFLWLTPVVAEEDPFLDLINKRDYDREAILRKFRNLEPLPPLTAPENPDTSPLEAEEEGISKTGPRFLELAPQPGARPEGAIEIVDSIALILPTNAAGLIASVADNFYQGCLAGLNSLGAQVGVALYASDGSSESALTAYEQALQDGAPFVIGPLQKNSVQSLLEAYPVPPVPTFLLQPGTKEYSWLSLDVGEEVSQLAKIIRQRGEHILIVQNESNLSRRQATAFASAWQGSSSFALDRFYIYEEKKDWQRLFERLKEKTSNEEDEVQFAVFAAGRGEFIRKTRNFVPQGLIVYASSIFAGSETGVFMDNLHVMEMPWFLPQIEKESVFSDSIIRTYPFLQQRFYASGLDVCRLASKAPEWSEDFLMQGETGLIEIKNGLFHRQGVLSRYQSGRLLPLNP